ncbi:MAG: 2-amino-4-hydroxy-6-hydroxymethyldihydropteridine diphosphokinase [Myxococcota bacterium]|nr:2-amino-4-hydroxy-6-hydroxymethyldihydropteridine diphosphokinase [Deltaproteobacteria bacterium]MCP4242885.1 2-amino-4-hydroxy-6-hydroxymethyldihydropteridine diphosphokinase [bacterium]MDP6075726.1 2-amino-4-hydroxy-6-hydroxymethyldihydropteridine diphosphokinase [Myxococcota bacterium]MDP7075470.1 2-amino-4-hydroxy-6-hydroxymethyldihydropteridine diphosphokinase [Myxococcota bacterium]MDP7299633.1 2-amino-4-hydroxy-6-hydroxymethyldihydropteridine diphosphokinase [Myxococcota bacterium]
MAEHETRACIALGSNLGDRVANLERAVDGLRAAPGVRVDALSPFYETDPVGGPPQGAYLNAAIALDTTLSPEELLELLQALEVKAGRSRDGERNTARVLDLDLLLYGAEKRDAPDLILPHPRMHERAFVLVPLADIVPEAVHPTLGESVAELASRLGRTGVRAATR